MQKRMVFELLSDFFTSFGGHLTYDDKQTNIRGLEGGS